MRNMLDHVIQAIEVLSYMPKADILSYVEERMITQGNCSSFSKEDGQDYPSNKWKKLQKCFFGESKNHGTDLIDPNLASVFSDVTLIYMIRVGQYLC
jgi:hypothetical protein